MKLSARNQVVGRVVSVEEGGVAAVVKVEIKVPFIITSLITKEGAEDLKLKKGDDVSVIVKSTEVIITKD